MGVGCTVQNTNSGIEPTAAMGLSGNATAVEVSTTVTSNTTAVGNVPQGVVK